MSGKKTAYARCDVYGCKGSTAESTHRVPDDAGLRQTWLRLMGWAATTRTRMFVCGRHFTPADFTQNPEVMQSAGFQAGRIRLKKNAVPSRFLPTDPPAHPPKKGNCKSNQGDADQTHTLHRGRADAAVAPLHRRYRRLAPLGIPLAMLPIFLASQPQYSQDQEVTAALASDDSDYELPNSSKCHCKCHPETSTKAVQTHTMGAWTQCATSTQTYVTKVVNTCLCSCHCMMSTAAVQTTPLARCTSCSQTNESFINATMTRVDACLQVCLDATICVTVGLQTDPKPPIVPRVVKRSRGRPVKISRGRPVKSSRRRVVRKK